MKHLIIERQDLFTRGRAAGRGCNDLRQWGQRLKGLGRFRPEAGGPVRQCFHPVLYADGKFFTANGTKAASLRSFCRGQAYAAAAVSIQVVLALLRKKFKGAEKALAGTDRRSQLRVG